MVPSELVRVHARLVSLLSRLQPLMCCALQGRVGRRLDAVAARTKLGRCPLEPLETAPLQKNILVRCPRDDLEHVPVRYPPSMLSLLPEMRLVCLTTKMRRQAFVVIRPAPELRAWRNHSLSVQAVQEVANRALSRQQKGSAGAELCSSAGGSCPDRQALQHIGALSFRGVAALQWRTHATGSGPQPT